MKRKTWVLTLVAVGLVVAATSAAVSLNHSTWFARDAPAAPGLAIPAASSTTPVPALPPGATPNYRAIVQQAGPDVVSVTVIGLASPGDTVRLKVWRDKSAREIMVKPGRAEDGVKTRAQGGAEGQRGQLGLTLRPLTREERAQANLGSGLVIEGVTGPAARAGLMPGHNCWPSTASRSTRSIRCAA